MADFGFNDSVLNFVDNTTGTTSFSLTPNGSVPSNYAVATDTTTQNIVTPGTFQNITFNTNNVLNGWTHTAGTADFTCAVSGLYLFLGFVHCNKTGGGTSLFEFRLTINGVAAGTIFGSTLNTNAETRPLTAVGIVQVLAGQIVRAQWTAGASSQIQAPVTVGATKSASINIMKIA